MCNSHDSLCLTPMSFSTDFNDIVPNAVLYKTLPSPMKSNLAMMNKLDLFLSSGSLNIYKSLSGLNPYADIRLTDGSIFPLARLKAWVFTVLQYVTTKNILGGSKHKLYGNALGNFLQMAPNWTISTDRRLADCSEPEKRFIPNIELAFDKQ